VSTEHENLTSQIDGIKSLFTTTLFRVLGKLTVFHNGARLSALSYSEPSNSQIQLVFTPSVSDKLHVIYETDATVQGRVLGFCIDPGGIPAPVIPPTTQTLIDNLQNQINILTTRVTALEAASGLKEKIVEPFAATSGQTAFTLAKTPVDVADVQVTLQGVEVQNGVEFSVLGTSFTWNSASPSVDALDAGDKLIVSYFFIP